MAQDKGKRLKWLREIQQTRELYLDEVVELGRLTALEEAFHKKAERVECHECGIEGSKRRMLKAQVYDDPWQKEPTEIFVHAHVPKAVTKDFPHHDGESCYDLLLDTGWGDFRYFNCAKCERTVIRQCPQNGWHSYVHVVGEDGGEEICARCYEEDIYKNGLPRSEFEDCRIPGMFFNRGDLEARGYDKVRGFIYFKVTGKETAKQFCDKALELIDSGRKVAVDYEALAIGGGEGYATLFATEGVSEKGLFDG